MVGLHIPIGSAPECEASVLRSIYSSSELKIALREPITDGHYGPGRYLIHESQDLALYTEETLL